MNVNPFSYLIEKLKGKVDKSGDTMSGNLSVQVSGNAYLKVTNTDKSVDATLNSASNGQHGLYSNGYNDGTFHDSGKWLINRQADGSTMINGNVEVPSQTGTLALTVQPKTNVTMYGILCQKYYGKFIALFPLPNAKDYTNITPLDMGMGYKYTDPTLTWGTVHKEENVIRIDINSGASDEHVGSFVYGHFNLS